MVKSIRTFEYIVTDTELEALLLECKMIKEIKPLYNKKIKKYKSYIYIKIQLNHKYPIPLICNEVEEDGAIYFGPFTSEGRVEAVLSFIKEYYPLRKCTSNSFGNRTSCCLNYELTNCSGPCGNKISEAEYKQYIEKVISFIGKKDNKPIEYIYEKMNELSLEMNYEEAAKYRDCLAAIEYLWKMIKMSNSSTKNRSIIACEIYKEENAKIFFIKGNSIIENINVNINEIQNLKALLLEIATKGLKSGKTGGNILEKHELDEAQIIYSYLRNKNSKINYRIIPKSCIKDKMKDKLNSIIDVFTEEVFADISKA
jgi:excinuclease ABC subunit C